MGEERANGVDGAIRLLKALSAGTGTGGVAGLAVASGLPRASFHRVAKTLAGAGLLELRRGAVSVGPLATHILAAHRADMAERATHQSILPASGDGVVALSKPLVRIGRRMRIGFANASIDNPWRVALVHSVESAAATLGDKVEWLHVRHAGDDSQTQARDIAALIKSGADGLIVSATSPAVGRAIASAMKNGIPVVTVDRGLGVKVPQTSFVSGDDAAIGRTTALWLAETLKGQGRLLLLAGHANAEPAQRRLDAAREIFAQFPDIEIAGTHWTSWRREEGKRLAMAAIEQWHGRIDGVWCDSGLQGVGSLQAFIAAGRKPGEIPPHTGGDLNVAFKLAVRHKVRLAGVDYPPAMGHRAVDVLNSTLNGQWVPRQVVVPSTVIITHGHATRSVKPDRWAEDHVRWDLPDDLILSSGLGPAYNPRSFRIHYPGNRYNRSASRLNEVRS